MWAVVYSVLLILSLWVSASCHALTTVGPCLVNREKATFDCSRQNLMSVPQQIWSNVTELDLSQNHLKLTHAKAFKELKNFDRLIKLNLSGNYLPLLVQQHFFHLPALEILDISGCQLRAIRTGALLSFPRLKKLFIGKNDLQTVISAVPNDHGWIKIRGLSSNLQLNDRSEQAKESGTRVYKQERWSVDGINKINHISFQRKLLTELLGASTATNTSNSTAESSKNVVKKPSDTWKYLVGVLVTAVSISALVAVVAKCKLIHRYLASYRHSRFSEADGTSQCDPSNFGVEFTSRRTSGSRPHYDNETGDMMEEDDDGFIEDNYIPTSDRERAEREAEHWEDKEEDDDDYEEEEEEEEIEFSIA